MNAPRAWPKNSLSYSSRGTAAQLTLISGLPALLAAPVDLPGHEFLARCRSRPGSGPSSPSGRPGRSAGPPPPGRGSGRSARRRPRPASPPPAGTRSPAPACFLSASISANARAVVDGGGGVVGDHPQPTHALGADGPAGEHGQHAQDLPAVDQRLPREAADAFRARPLRSGDPVGKRLTEVGHLDRLAAGRDLADLPHAEREAPERPVDPRPLGGTAAPRIVRRWRPGTDNGTGPGIVRGWDSRCSRRWAAPARCGPGRRGASRQRGWQ